MPTWRAPWPRPAPPSRSPTSRRAATTSRRPRRRADRRRPSTSSTSRTPTSVAGARRRRRGAARADRRPRREPGRDAPPRDRADRPGRVAAHPRREPHRHLAARPCRARADAARRAAAGSSTCRRSTPSASDRSRSRRTTRRRPASSTSPARWLPRPVGTGSPPTASPLRSSTPRAMTAPLADDPERLEWFRERTMLGRLGDPETDLDGPLLLPRERRGGVPDRTDPLRGRRLVGMVNERTAAPRTALLLVDYQVALCEEGEHTRLPALAAQVRERGVVATASTRARGGARRRRLRRARAARVRPDVRAAQQPHAALGLLPRGPRDARRLPCRADRRPRSHRSTPNRS